jgi:hypothetical protein
MRVTVPRRRGRERRGLTQRLRNNSQWNRQCEIRLRDGNLLVLGALRWPTSEGWMKMRQTIESAGPRGPIGVRYDYNPRTGQGDDLEVALRDPERRAGDPAVSPADRPQ